MASQITTQTYDPEEIRALGDQALFPTVGVTLAAGNGPFVAGQVLGMITASGKAKDYDDAASDGSEVAAGVLAEDADPSGSNDLIAAMYIGGVFKETKLTGLDANGKTDLKGVSLASHDLFRF